MERLRRRSGVILLVLLGGLVLGAVKVAYLGVVKGPALSRAASEQQLATESILAPRGTITDRNGIDLAISEPAQEITADPHLVTNAYKEAAQLGPLLGISTEKLTAKLSENKGFVYLDRSLPQTAAEQVEKLALPGIEHSPVLTRVYPQGQLAGQLLGLVGTEGKPLSGLEYYLNKDLAGHDGSRRTVRDAIGQPVAVSETRPARPGDRISLTIDANIQQRVEAVLDAVSHAFKPTDATAIVMDPRTGAILAQANWPFFNPSSPGSDATAEMENRAVGFDYEPGSTFKPVTISGALENNLITPDSVLAVPGAIQVADRVIHDDTEHGVEDLTVSQILARSSNVGTIEIAAKLGANRFAEWVSRYGFGKPTGVDEPGEESGLTLRVPEFSGSSMGNLPIGQGELVTPMQMVTAYAAIANGGILRPPHVVASINGHRLPLPKGRRVITPRTAFEIRRMLEGVLGPEGTASQVSVPGYSLAGKTGTANKIDPTTHEYSESKFVASFLGFAPALHPRLLTAVVVDEPTAGSVYGGHVAAPAFGEIMAYALPYLSIPQG